MGNSYLASQFVSAPAGVAPEQGASRPPRIAKAETKKPSSKTTRALRTSVPAPDVKSPPGLGSEYPNLDR